MTSPHPKKFTASDVKTLAELIQGGIQRILGDEESIVAAKNTTRQKLLTKAFQRLVDAQPEALLTAAQNQSSYQVQIRSTNGGYADSYCEEDLASVEPFQILKSAFEQAGHPIKSVSFSNETRAVADSNPRYRPGDIRNVTSKNVGINVNLSFRS